MFFLSCCWSDFNPVQIWNVHWSLLRNYHCLNGYLALLYIIKSYQLFSLQFVHTSFGTNFWHILLNSFIVFYRSVIFQIYAFAFIRPHRYASPIHLINLNLVLGNVVLTTSLCNSNSLWCALLKHILKMKRSQSHSKFCACYHKKKTNKKKPIIIRKGQLSSLRVES